MTPEDVKGNDRGSAAPDIATRNDVLNLLNELIGRVNNVKRVYVGTTFSAIILAPLSISLSTYLVFHPSFYRLLDSEEGFGYVLAGFLGFLVSLSSTWLVAGLRQYQTLKKWNRKYDNYLASRITFEKSVAAQKSENDEAEDT